MGDLVTWTDSSPFYKGRITLEKVVRLTKTQAVTDRGTHIKLKGGLVVGSGGGYHSKIAEVATDEDIARYRHQQLSYKAYNMVKEISDWETLSDDVLNAVIDALNPEDKSG